jgi:plastocyanin
MHERIKLNRGRFGLRGLVAIGLAAGVSALAAPGASAAPANITAGSGAMDVFVGSPFSHEAGTIAQMTWAGGGPHNATASGQGPDGKALFRSETISSGSTAVNGSQYVALGVYPFICTVHPTTMQANLNVNSGSPLPRPQLALKVKDKSLDKVIDTGKVRVAVTITGGSGESAKVNLKLGKKTIGSGEASATRTLKVKLTKKGRGALAKKEKAKVKANGSIDFGGPAAATGNLK